VVNFGRVLTAMVTPFNSAGELDYQAASNLALRLVENGSDGLLIAGTTGESPTLSAEEKIRLFSTVVETVGGKATVLAGTGTNDTKKSIELTKEAEKTGVDGIMAVAPYYSKPPQEGLYQHFKMIAESTSLPVMVYNIPSRTGINITPRTMVRLAEVENIVALKEAAGDLNQASELIRLLPKEFSVYSGDDSLTLPILAVGGAGIISVAAHIVGRRLKSMVNDYFQGKIAEAMKTHEELMPLFKVLFITANPIMVKSALRLLGIEVGALRLPLIEATSEQLEELKTVLRGLGLI